ncbi:MAG: hypothetical protein WC067_03465 [Candidatus Methanomethylophilaceae archaeon]
MSSISLKCPKCSRFADFGEGKLFGFCTCCGSKVERSLDGKVSIYDRDSEKDEYVRSLWDRFDVCSRHTIPDRKDYDIASFDSAVEHLLDTLMSFTETQKDIIAGTVDYSPEEKCRTYEICSDLNMRLEKKFNTFLVDNRDSGMYEEFRSIDRMYSERLQKLSNTFEGIRKKSNEEYWSQHAEEYNRLQTELKDAMNKKTKLTFLDFEGKWAADAEINRINALLNRTPDQ